jgi:hypothetical protein
VSPWANEHNSCISVIWEPSYNDDPSGRSLAGVAGSSPVRGTDVCVVCVLYSEGQKAKSQENRDTELRIKHKERGKEGV